jgi:histidinol phosphatase-like PHP family hydrolase
MKFTVEELQVISQAMESNLETVYIGDKSFSETAFLEEPDEMFDEAHETIQIWKSILNKSEQMTTNILCEEE